MILDIWNSFRRMPLWVQVWVAAVLVPLNMAPLLFLNEPYAVLVAALSVGGMMPNVVIMLTERGLSRCMAWPHLAIWVPLVIVLGWLLLRLEGAGDGYVKMLALLLIVDLISLSFDIPDAIKWLRGDRDIA